MRNNDNEIWQEAYEAGEKARDEWMEKYICFRFGHSLAELEKHLPEIRRIFGDPEPDPLRRGQGSGERR